MLLPIARIFLSTPVLGTRGLSWLSRRHNYASLLHLAVAWLFVGISNVSAQPLTPGILAYWDHNAKGWTSVLADLSGVTAIATASYHRLRLTVTNPAW